MNSNLQNKLVKFGVFLALYTFGIFVFFNSAFSKKEIKVDVTKKEETTTKTDTTLNANGIDVKKLSTKVNGGNKINLLNEKIIRDGLKNTTDKDIKEILKSENKLSIGYLALLYRNPSAKLFVKDKLENKVIDNFTGESVSFKRSIPYYLQWDRRWGQKKYTDENIAINGCGPTCMAMVVSGLSKDNSITPVELAKYEEYAEGAGTGWKYFTEVPKKYGLTVKEVGNDEQVYKNELKSGRPIIVNVGKGDFSTIGHYIVLVGVDKQGNFIINDPNSPQNTNDTWTFERLKPQIKNAWSFSKGD